MLQVLAGLCLSLIPSALPPQNAQKLLHRPTLYLGDMAPSLQGTTWLRGAPITDWKGSKLTVVEFWATWCQPCKAMAPHLTALAKKYAGTIRFVGMDCREEQPSVSACTAAVRRFLNEMGPKMGYTIAMDNQASQVFDTWMVGAGLHAIPNAYIVNQQGRILWIGHPSNIDNYIPSILDGTYNLGSRIGLWRKSVETRLKDSAYDIALTPVQQAVRSRDYTAAAANVDKLIAVDPNAAPDLLIHKVGWLSKQDSKAAMRFALQLADTKFKDDAANLGALAWTMIEDGSPVNHPDYTVALDIAQRAVKAAPDDPEVLNVLALAYSKAHKLPDAASAEAEAVDKASKTPDFDPDILSDYRARLSTYRSATVGGSHSR